MPSFLTWCWRQNLGKYLQMDPAWVFALVARLRREDCSTDALRVLATYQAIEQVDSVTSVLAGVLAAVWPGRPLWAIPTALVCGEIVGLVLLRLGLIRAIRLTGLLALGNVWTYVPAIPFQVAAMLALLLAYGWTAPLMWLGGYVGSIIANTAIEFWLTGRRYRRTGLKITASGANFLHAYRLHAKRLGVTTDMVPTKQEMASDEAEQCYAEFAAKCPEGAAKFRSSA
jgi:hypothetical protein